MKLKKIALVIGMVLITAFVLMMIGDKIKSNVIKEQQLQENYSTWLAQNCKCLERNIIFCQTGFTLKNEVCINESAKTYTSVLLSCSEYNCSGEIKSWNNETNKWEDNK